MPKTVDFYIDMISPFSYLAQLKLPEIARRYGYDVHYRPIDIPAAKKAAGNYGPSNRDVPAKLKVLSADMQRWANRYGVPLVFPKTFECRLWNIGILFAQKHGVAERYVREAYDLIWGQGIDPGHEKHLHSAVLAAGLNAEEFLGYVHSSQGDTDFQHACASAHAAGIFGAPIIAIDDQMWWGNDRLDFVEEYLREIVSDRADSSRGQ